MINGSEDDATERHRQPYVYRHRKLIKPDWTRLPDLTERHLE